MKEQETIMNLFQGLMQTRAILTAAELDLFTQLHQEPSTAQNISQKNKIDLRALTRLLDSLVVLNLLTKQDSVYAVTPSGERLSAEHPATDLPIVLHLNGLWDTWSCLTESVKEGRNIKWSDAIYKDQERQNAFIGAMHALGRDLAEEIARSLDLAPYKKLLDIGGGSGTYTMAFLKKNPEMTAVLFDLESVIPLAEQRLRNENYLERVTLKAGDLYLDAFPPGCDLVLLSAIIHQNSPAQNSDLYKRIHTALEPGGALIIRDHIMDDDRTSPPGGTFFALNMLVNTQGGDTYTFTETKESLEHAGFIDIRLSRKGEKMDCLVEARK